MEILPLARSVGVRTPMMKRVIYDEAGTTEAEMKARKNKARTGRNMFLKWFLFILSSKLSDCLDD